MVASRSFPVLLAAAVAWGGATGRAADDPPSVSPRVDTLLTEAATTGRAVLAVAGYRDCARCRRLRERLQGEAALQPVVSQFARLDLTMDGPDGAEWRPWQKMTETRSRASPQVFVVRADRKVLHDGEAPDDLGGFLRSMAQAAGTPLTPAQAEQFAALLEQATALAADGDRSGALRKLLPAVKAPSYASAAVAARGFCTSLADEAETAIAAAADTVGDDADGVAAAVELVAIARGFGTVLPDVARDATRQIVALRKNPDVARVLKQAEQIQAADVAARQLPSRARAMYEKIAAEHPGGGAAAVAASRLEKLAAAAAE